MSNANRRQFLQTVAGAAALSVSAEVVTFGRMRRLRMTTAMPDPQAHDRLQPDWYRKKIRQVQQEMQKRKLDALLLLNAHNVIYTTGYFHLSTERPLAALIPKSGDPVLFVPELESDQVKLWWVKDYESYFDFPGPVNRVRWILERVAKRGFVGPLCEADRQRRNPDPTGVENLHRADEALPLVAEELIERDPAIVE